MQQKNSLIILSLLFLAMACHKQPGTYKQSDESLEIYPDYLSVTVPPNIAPLNFQVLNEGDLFTAKISNSAGRSITVRSRTGSVKFPIRAWKRLLEEDRGGALTLQVYNKRKGKGWQKFNPIINPISRDEIDPYISYRKIAPGHIVWGEMGIYQRSLESFKESAIMLNNVTGKNCMNCHTFNAGNPEQMMFHMRGSFGGTVVAVKDQLQFVNTRSEHTRSAGAYASWHPEGELIAFSVNTVSQAFHSRIGKQIHVFDSYSDIVLYDVKNNIITRPAELSSEKLENLPSWSNDGKNLYYICADKKADSVPFISRVYNLMRIEFDEERRKFGRLDTLISTNEFGKSITHARESPTGDLISFVGLEYGYFSIFNHESDVYLYNTKTGRITLPEINSEFTESYPSWSRNGSWLMFISKREDGLLSQVWFSHIDGNGKTGKPFLLPQRNPDFYKDYLLNFNRPEFITGKVKLNPRSLFPIINAGPEGSSFNSEESVSLSTGATIPIREESGEHYQYD